MTKPAQEAVYVELTIRPIPPDTVSSIKAEIVPMIEEAFREAGHEDLLLGGQVRVEVEKAIPPEKLIQLGLKFLSAIAVEVFKATVLPRLKKRFQVEEEEQKQGKDKE